MTRKNDGMNATTESGLECQEEWPKAPQDKTAMTQQVAMMQL
jgi:hypothetical protein